VLVSVPQGGQLSPEVRDIFGLIATKEAHCLGT